MKVDTKSIAEYLKSKGFDSSTKNIDDLITELILDQINTELVELSNQVITDLQEMERPKNITREEYEEKYADKG